MTLQDEAVGLLQQLLRLNTVNPPGNETIAAELLRDYLQANGVEVELYARTPERANLVARLKGGDGPSLCFLSHTDTVVADPVEWSRDPWSGDLADDHVWGRGALDMKNQVAASAVAIASLAREGFKPAGDLVFVASADEEVGKNFGLQWLCEEHPDTVRVDYAINEGGGERVELGGNTYYLCAAAEKMTAPFRLVVHGRSGHGSMPGIADNALVKTAPLIEKLAAYRPEPSIGPEVAGFLEAVLGEQPAPADVLSRLAAVDQLAVETIEPLLSFTLSPTMIEASERRNVIPGTCELSSTAASCPGKRRRRSSRSCARSSATASTSWRRSSAGAELAPHSTRRSGRRSRIGSARRSRERSWRHCAAPASPTRTGFARPSAPSRTASSRCGQWTSTWPPA